MTHKISKKDYRQLKEWQNTVKTLQKISEDYYQRVMLITKEVPDRSLTFDWFYNDFVTLDELLKRLDIKVEK